MLNYAHSQPNCARVRQKLAQNFINVLNCAKLRHKRAKCLKCVWFGTVLTQFWHGVVRYSHHGTFWHILAHFLAHFGTEFISTEGIDY